MLSIDRKSAFYIVFGDSDILSGRLSFAWREKSVMVAKAVEESKCEREDSEPNQCCIYDKHMRVKRGEAKGTALGDGDE